VERPLYRPSDMKQMGPFKVSPMGFGTWSWVRGSCYIPSIPSLCLQVLPVIAPVIASSKQQSELTMHPPVFGSRLSA
jgi:hypothetical protein